MLGLGASDVQLKLRVPSLGQFAYNILILYI